MMNGEGKILLFLDNKVNTIDITKLHAMYGLPDSGHVCPIIEQTLGVTTRTSSNQGKRAITRYFLTQV